MNENEQTKTLSSFIKCTNNEKIILEHLLNSSKSVYNIMNFIFSIYTKFKNNIFSDLNNHFYVKNFIYLLKRNKDFKFGNKNATNETDNINNDEDNNKFKFKYNDEVSIIGEILYSNIFPYYYNLYCETKNIIKENNSIIFDFIKNFLKDILIDNQNFKHYYDIIIDHLFNNNIIVLDNKYNDYIISECKNIVYNILKSFYFKNYNFIENQIKSHIKVDSKFSENFINHVKAKNKLFQKDKCISSKVMLGFELTSDQNIISILSRRYIEKDNNANLIAPDVIVSIINKAYENIKSFYSLKASGQKVNIPKYLKNGETFILKFDKQSKKIIKKNNKYYLRLALGKNVCNKYLDLINASELVCLNKDELYKKYIDPYLLKSINNKYISKSKNYILEEQNLYIEKNNKNIIEGQFLYLLLPSTFTNNIKNDDFSELDKIIRCIEIYKNHNKIKVNYIYKSKQSVKEKIDLKKIDPKDAISIDLGISNLMTIYDPSGKQIIIKGGYLIHQNNIYNEKIDKQISYLSLSNQKIKTSKKLDALYIKRENIITNYFDQLIKWLSKKYKDKKCIIIGYNEGWKEKVNLGKKNNRKFYNIPYAKLLLKLKTKFENKLIVTEESYTSKCDALALEEVKKQENYLGNRAKRGLFESSVGKLINADLNGAINIMRKKLNLKKIDGIDIFSPQVIKIEDFEKEKIKVSIKKNIEIKLKENLKQETFEKLDKMLEELNKIQKYKKEYVKKVIKIKVEDKVTEHRKDNQNKMEETIIETSKSAKYKKDIEQKKENAKDSKKNIFDYKDKSKYNIKSENKESEKKIRKKVHC